MFLNRYFYKLAVLGEPVKFLLQDVYRLYFYDFFKMQLFFTWRRYSFFCFIDIYFFSLIRIEIFMNDEQILCVLCCGTRHTLYINVYKCTLYINVPAWCMNTDIIRARSPPSKPESQTNYIQQGNILVKSTLCTYTHSHCNAFQ